MSDTLSIIAIGATVLLAGIAQTDWKQKPLVYGLIGAGVLIVLVGFAFPWLQGRLPRAATFVGDIASNPVTWFSTVTLLLSVDIWLRRRNAPTDRASQNDVRRLEAELKKRASEQIATNIALSNMIGQLEDRVDKVAINVQSDVKDIRESIRLLGKQIEDSHQLTGQGQMRLRKAILARNAQELIKRHDTIATDLAVRLISGNGYDTQGWLVAFREWKDALSIIDTVAAEWRKGYSRLLDITVSDIEHVIDLPPQHLDRDHIMTQFKTLRIANDRYRDSRSETLNFFAAAVADL